MKNNAVLSSAAVNPPSNTRTCVYRTGHCGDATVRINLNEAIGLEPYSDYLISEYLEDQTQYEGRTILAVDGNLYLFSDGTVENLTEEEEEMGKAGLAELAAMDEFFGQHATAQH